MGFVIIIFEATVQRRTIRAAQEIATEALGGKIESEGKAMTIFDF
jgi:hypothetical protein